MAQSASEDALKFERMSNYLELTSQQIKPAKNAFAQLEASLNYFNSMDDSQKPFEASKKMINRHKATMKKILSEKQYNKYVAMLDLTAKNTAERIQDQQMASK
jgi:hypothetical protein